MQKIILPLVLMAVVNFCHAQYNPRPTKSRFFNSKHSTFQIKKGDILVYQLTSDKETTDILLTVTSFAEDISFDYNVPEKNQQGKVTLESKAVNTATNYPFWLDRGSPSISTGSVIWLSRKTWRDLASKDKKTTINMGSGSETFARASASTLKIKLKGREKIITTYDIVNQDVRDKKHFSVLTDEQNPLIVRMNMLGNTLTLKEVR
jgi:hypothetical protein